MGDSLSTPARASPISATALAVAPFPWALARPASHRRLACVASLTVVRFALARGLGLRSALRHRCLVPPPSAPHGLFPGATFRPSRLESSHRRMADLLALPGLCRQ